MQHDRRGTSKDVFLLFVLLRTWLEQCIVRMVPLNSFFVVVELFHNHIKITAAGNNHKAPEPTTLSANKPFDRLVTHYSSRELCSCYLPPLFHMVMEQLPQTFNKEQLFNGLLTLNTVPCIAYATYKIKSKRPQCCFVVAPSDHVILKEEEFRLLKNGLILPSKIMPW